MDVPTKTYPLENLFVHFLYPSQFSWYIFHFTLTNVNIYVLKMKSKSHWNILVLSIKYVLLKVLFLSFNIKISISVNELNISLYNKRAMVTWYNITQILKNTTSVYTNTFQEQSHNLQCKILNYKWSLELIVTENLLVLYHGRVGLFLYIFLPTNPPPPTHLYI